MRTRPPTEKKRQQRVIIRDFQSFIGCLQMRNLAPEPIPILLALMQAVLDALFSALAGSIASASLARLNESRNTASLASPGSRTSVFAAPDSVAPDHHARITTSPQRYNPGDTSVASVSMTGGFQAHCSGNESPKRKHDQFGASFISSGCVALFFTRNFKNRESSSAEGTSHVSISKLTNPLPPRR